MNTTNQNQSQKPETTYEPKEQLEFSYAILEGGDNYEDGGGYNNLEEVYEGINDHLLALKKSESPLKDIYKIEIWIGTADEYDKIEFEKEDLGYMPNGKVTRAYGKKEKETYDYKCNKCDKWLKTSHERHHMETEKCCGEPIYQEN